MTTSILPITPPPDGSNRLDAILERAIKAYACGDAPIEVDFRRLAPFGAGAERATHLIHPYPAKLLLNIPYSFLRCADLTPSGATILDPFCGSGTVLLEGMLKGLRADGCDSNPLARIITAAKTTAVDPGILATELERIIAESRSGPSLRPDVVNVDYWFYPKTRQALGKLACAIPSCCTQQTLPFFQACFSACVRRVSLADPRLSVPVRINPDRATRYGAKGDDVLRRLKRLRRNDAIQTFWRIASQNIIRMHRLLELKPQSASAPNVFGDARSINAPDGGYDLVLTSPPYVGAQKYIRASCLSLGWLGLTPDCALRPLERRSIGREHLTQSERLSSLTTNIPDADQLIELIEERNPLRAHIASLYLHEMRSALQEAARVTKVGGHLVLVVGANMVAGYAFDSPSYLRQISEATGFRMIAHLLDDIRSRGLMVKRNKTAGMITRESVLVFRREAQ